MGVVSEACRASPALLYLPHIDLWWEAASLTLRTVLRTLLQDLPPDLPLFLFATTEVPVEELDPEVLMLFSPKDVLDIPDPLGDHRRAFFAPIMAAAIQPPQPPAVDPAPVPSLLPPPPLSAPVNRRGARESAFPPPTPQELEEQEHSLRQLRMFLRDLVTQLLRDRRWELFAAPVSEEEAPGYGAMVPSPMDLSTILWRVDDGHYTSLKTFLADINLVPIAARQYHDPEDPDGQRIISRSHTLVDMVHVAAGQLDPSLVSFCEAVSARRRAHPHVPGAKAAAASPLGDPASGAATRGSSRLRGDKAGSSNMFWVEDPEALGRRMRAQVYIPLPLA